MTKSIPTIRQSLYECRCQRNSRILRVYAGTSQKEQFINLVLIRRMNNVGLDGNILIDKLRRINLVAPDASDSGGCQKYILRLLRPKKFFYLVLPYQVKFGMRSGDDIGVTISFKYMATKKGDWFRLFPSKD